jgi:hypothetical protein
VTDEEAARVACFEAGIKLGALYHQFVGTPVSRDSVTSLEEAVKEAVESQRYVVDADVSVEGVSHNRFDYDELRGTMLDVHVTVEKDGVAVDATIDEEDGYPMMRIDEVRDV